MWSSMDATQLHQCKAFLNYLEKECNDVAVCRAWRYGRSSMERKSPKTRHGISYCCAHAQLSVIGDEVKAGGRRTVRHMAHDSEGVCG
jgi:hypothetical protein